MMSEMIVPLCMCCVCDYVVYECVCCTLNSCGFANALGVAVGVYCLKVFIVSVLCVACVCINVRIKADECCCITVGCFLH